MVVSCSECGDILKDEKTCQDHFNQMLAWDFEDFEGAGQVHHLTVLCYRLQHPSLYSKEALKGAQKMLKEIIENNLSGSQFLEKTREDLKVQDRKWKFKGDAENHGEYTSKIVWKMTVSQVTVGGLGKYPELVRKWADSIYDEFKDRDWLI